MAAFCTTTSPEGDTIMSLKNRNAVVTGSTSGIGLAYARALAREGANVCLNGFGKPDEIERERAALGSEFKVEAIYSGADMTKPDEIAGMIATAKAKLGSVDILINNAGVQFVSPIEEFPVEKWDQIIAINLSAAFHAIKAALPQMKQRKWGRIINVLNTGAKAPRANGAPTAVSRAAGMAFMKVLAGEGAPHGILVNGMLVGQIVSDQVARRHAREGTNVPFEEYVASVGKGIPVGRMGKAEEFAAMACFLCSDHAGFTTGTAINMDGGASPVV
jgi:3-oxoacyl-[acyl-carrier protein] reductase